MKNRFTKFILATAVALISFSFVSKASCDQKDDWRDRMRAEKIAFFTAEIGLEPAEAEKFWPIYNQQEAEKGKSFDACMKAFRALDDAIKAGKPEKEISTLLDKYLEATHASQGIDEKYVEKYKKVLSTEKIAKMYLAEEKFRRNQIHRLNQGPKKDE